MPAPLLLIIDSDADSRIRIARLFEERKIQVVTAADTGAALTDPGSLGTGLILLFLRAPDYAANGYESLRALTQSSGATLLLSGDEHARRSCADKIALLAGEEWISCPITDADLVARVRMHLRHRELNNRLRESEAHLAAAQNRFTRLVETNAQGIMFWNKEGTLTGANDAFLRMVGYTREDLAAGKLAWPTMTPPEWEELDRVGYATLLRDGIAGPFEKEYYRKDGSRVPILLSAAVFEDTYTEGVCFVIDLTERKKAETQFLRAQRMECVGTLAGGIAHDLNNLLSPIVMGLDLLREFDPAPRSQRVIENLARNAKRSADLIRQVLSFSRGVDARVDLQLRHIIHEVESIATDTFPRKIRIETDVAKDLSSVTADPTQLHQVLLNLCINARDAMPGGGTLRIVATNADLDALSAAISPSLTPGHYVKVQVSDTGCGIPADIQAHIFDPFFTTKETGKGTGLGLSTARDIVHHHGGFIHVDSTPGQGSTFTFYVRATQPGHSDDTTRDATPKPYAQGQGQTILLIDDELSILEIAKQTLEKFNYRVITATDGAQAVSLYAQHSAQIKLVLTDMMMPVMDGPALIVALRYINPAVRIIATSGVPQTTLSNVSHFLPKPYTTEALLSLTHRVLTEPAK